MQELAREYARNKAINMDEDEPESKPIFRSNDPNSLCGEKFNAHVRAQKCPELPSACIMFPKPERIRLRHKDRLPATFG